MQVVVSDGQGLSQTSAYQQGVRALGTPPTITRQPQSQMIGPGQTALMIVEVTGTEPFTYQWYQGTTGDTAHPIAGATLPFYTTPALTNTTSYWVRVSNGYPPAADSNTATIAVERVPPAITTQPRSQTIVSGQTVTLFVAATGTPPLTYQWYRGISGNLSNPISGATESSYTTPALITTSYWVRVSNAFSPPADSATATITVEPAPQCPALVLDGTTAYAAASSTVFPNTTSLVSFTAEAWIYPTGIPFLPFPPQMILSDDAYDLTFEYQPGALHGGNGVGIGMFLYGPNGSSEGSTEYRDVRLNQWNHVALVFDVVAKQARLAINGIMGSPLDVSLSGFGTFSNNFTVGAFSATQKQNFFRGYIDNVRVSDVARYNANFVPTASLTRDANTRALYFFNEVSGLTTFADASGNGNTLTGAGGAHAGPAPNCDVRDTIPPVVSIESPRPDALYAIDQIVNASYTCTDEGGVATCAGPVASGEAIDTSFAGPHKFTVTATDAAGNASRSSVSYTVLEPPAIVVLSPREPIYELGSTVLAQYTCGSSAVTCVGGVANGAPIDTSTPGFHSFSITATDAVGSSTTELVMYLVSLGSCVVPFDGLTAWLPGDGRAVDTVTGTTAIWTGTETYAAGKVAQGFAVGAGQSLSLPFQQAGPFTLQAWVRTTDRLQAEFTGLISTGVAGQEPTSLQIELDGTGDYRLNAGNGELSLLIGPATELFQHVSVTFDGTLLSVYLNGQLTENGTWVGAPGLGFQTLTVGLDRELTRPFNGVVDEVQVFSRALTAAEVLETVLTGTAGLCKSHPPVAVASASPNPAEATGPSGATVVLDGTASSDPDGEGLTYAWREGATMIGSGSTLPVVLGLGSHRITLTVHDGHFESASTDFTVVVQDTTPPSFSNVPTDLTVEATGPSGAIATWTDPAATDLVDSAVAVSCAPTSGTRFAIDRTAVTCSTTDAHGNTATATFNVLVRDTTAPVLSDVPPNQVVEATSASGAVVTFTSPTGFDVVDGAVAVRCSPASSSLFALGVTTVTCAATDAHGNTRSTSFEVTVRDTTAPIINVPSPVVAEATSPAGALVTWTALTASDAVDGDVTVTCVPASGSVFALGTTTVSCSAADAHGNNATATFSVTVQDTTAPTLTLPSQIIVEASGPFGAAVSYVATASDRVSGALTVSCVPASGSGFPIGATAVSCKTTDGAGNSAVGGFSVLVVDTTAPVVQIASPSTDAMFASGAADVIVQTSDVVGVTGVTVNGVAATSSGTAQAGTWRATVPIVLPVTAGGALHFDVVAMDAGGNRGLASLVVDNDGIAATIDHSRTGGVDQSATFTSDFNNGTTAGTVTRGAWTVKLSGAPASSTFPAGGVRAAVSGGGAGTVARIAACTGAAKEVRLDQAGETADLVCDPTTGTITVKALSALPRIEVWKQQANNTWTSAQLPTGATYSTGSPATASADNTAPIDVQVVQFDDAGVATVVGTFQLPPGASVDVAVTAGPLGIDDQVRFNVLRGVVKATFSGRTRLLRSGELATMSIDRPRPPRDR